MHRHALAERGDPRRKRGPALGLELRRPLGEHGLSRPMQASDLLVAEAAGALRGRKAGAMQDLVGIGIPDPREAGRFGQCTLDGARQTREPGRERLPGGTGDLQPAPIERPKLLCSPADPDGGPFLGTPLDEPEVSAFRRARLESPLESPDREIPAGREAHRFPRTGTLRPVEPSRHRQVDGAEKVLLELHHELLSDPPHAGGEASDHRFGWRFDRNQEVWRRDPETGGDARPQSAPRPRSGTTRRRDIRARIVFRGR